jgi:hypothetical protein
VPEKFSVVVLEPLQLHHDHAKLADLRLRGDVALDLVEVVQHGVALGQQLEYHQRLLSPVRLGQLCQPLRHFLNQLAIEELDGLVEDDWVLDLGDDCLLIVVDEPVAPVDAHIQMAIVIYDGPAHVQCQV